MQINEMDHTFVNDDGHMISFATSQYYEPPRKITCIRGLRSDESHSDCSATETC